ncbi:DUF664 domain-containing protein [Paraliobacillus ryukyuensis]|uniref:DUF664 domain-containing protein n=1 Tax=Paraliobacillus ryukyuensis TaxID=200904 RepID=UPI0009A79180|nr:DUF664 domain-containing protein [Paraliobacillus ryukyuensis]
MTLRQFLQSQLKATYNQNTWFVSLKSALHGLSEKEAMCKKQNQPHSITEIVQHLIFYNQLELERFNHKKTYRDLPSTEQTFTYHHKESWLQKTVMLDAIFNAWDKAIAEASEEKLNEWQENLSYLTLHNAYHIGQIVLIRKEIDAWNDKYGVNYNF